jgi:tetratricopeptide (TPR) repeat protein
MSKKKSYYRRITESLPQRVYFINYFILFLTMSLIFASILSPFLYFKMLEAKNTRAHPNSPDAFFEAGYYAFKLGDKETAGQYLKKAINLDPEFERAKELSKKLK